MILFLDTEFTGLGQRWPCLISIGLISEDGQNEFYAELTAESYMEKCDPWVKENVLPLLEGGECIVQPDELSLKLAAWIGALGAVRIASDSGIDFDFLRSTLNPWPLNIDPKWINLASYDQTGYDFADAVNSVPMKDTGLRLHHALDDAKTNRLSWLFINEDARRPAP